MVNAKCQVCRTDKALAETLGSGIVVKCLPEKKGFKWALQRDGQWKAQSRHSSYGRSNYIVDPIKAFSQLRP